MVDTTQKWLRTEIAGIEAVEPSTKARLGAGWRTRRAQALLATTMTQFTPLTAKARVAPGDVAAAALEAWHAAGFDIPDGHDAWAWTGAAVRRILDHEAQADRLLTARDSQNVRHGADLPVPVRFDATEPTTVLEDRALTVAPTSQEPALTLAAQFAQDYGLTEEDAWRLIDALATVVLGDDFDTRAGRPKGVNGRRSAVTTLQREKARVATDLGISDSLVSAVTKLAFGSRERGGLLELSLDRADYATMTDYVTRFSAKNLTQSSEGR